MGYSLLSITDVLGFFFFLGLVNINLLNNIQMSSSQHKDKGRAEKEKKQDVMSCLPIYGSPFSGMYKREASEAALPLCNAANAVLCMLVSPFHCRGVDS